MSPRATEEVGCDKLIHILKLTHQSEVYEDGGLSLIQKAKYERAEDSHYFSTLNFLIIINTTFYFSGEIQLSSYGYLE